MFIHTLIRGIAISSFLRSAASLAATILNATQFSISYARESFDINRENARVLCSPGFYLRNTTSLRKKEEMAMLRIKVCMNIIFIVSGIYAHFLIPKITLNSPGHCLKYTFVKHKTRAFSRFMSKLSRA
jgi:hypothetical protein